MAPRESTFPLASENDGQFVPIWGAYVGSQIEILQIERQSIDSDKIQLPLSHHLVGMNWKN